MKKLILFVLVAALLLIGCERSASAPPADDDLARIETLESEIAFLTIDRDDLISQMDACVSAVNEANDKYDFLVASVDLSEDFESKLDMCEEVVIQHVNTIAELTAAAIPTEEPPPVIDVVYEEVCGLTLTPTRITARVYFFDDGNFYNEPGDVASDVHSGYNEGVNIYVHPESVQSGQGPIYYLLFGYEMENEGYGWYVDNNTVKVIDEWCYDRVVE